METMRKYKVFLINTLSADADYILQHAVQGSIIIQREYGNIKHVNHTAETKVTNLLDTVMSRGERECLEFVDLLRQSEVQETFPMLSQHFSPEHPSSNQGNPGRAADEITEYKMSSIPRGFCLIINNITFSSPNKTRRGSEQDEASLSAVFQWLGYSLDVHRNQTAEQMKQLLKDYSQKDHKGDCFVCCIMSHGCEKGVQGTDEAIVSNNDIFGPFSGVSCPSLVNKPKVFFIQACQGSVSQPFVEVQSDNSEEMGADVEMKDDEMLEMDAVKMITIPSAADFLVAISTIKGYVSFRDSSTGSLFMQSLCKQLKEYCLMGEDVPTILLSVNKEVSDKDFIRIARLAKQMPVYKATLRKKLVFHVPNQQ